jgi:non-specific serine/threonine protein kinase
MDHFPDGVWFVELAALADPNLISQTIMVVLGLDEQKGETALKVLGGYLANKKLLIILDNCEHLIEASAKVALALLMPAPEIKILASSREALGIKGEIAWHVPSLAVPDLKARIEIEQLTQYESVHLFIERASLVQPHFKVDKANAPAIAQICSRLDGIPLAIELAVARLKILSADQIAARLDDRFHLLTGGARTALPRHQTLRALIDWFRRSAFREREVVTSPPGCIRRGLQSGTC